MRMKDKVTVITGSTSGIGRSTALRFAEEGANVVVTGTNIEHMNETLKIGCEKGLALESFIVDVTKKDHIDNLFEFIDNKYGKLDCFINNAGINADSTLLKMTEEQWDDVIDVNLKGVFVCGQAAAKYMAKHGRGVILNTSSVVGIYGNFGQTNYSASKWGVIGLTKTWSKELGGKGIRVNAVAPGFILTPMTERMPEKVLDTMKEKAPLKTLGYPDDVANAFLFLASDEARFITGAVLSVDGGIVL